MERHALKSEFLQLDERTKVQLIDLARRLSAHQKRLADVWRSSYQQSSDMEQGLYEGEVGQYLGELLEAFFEHVAAGDFDGYYRRVLNIAEEVHGSELPYGLLLAIHQIEQVALPILSHVYDSQSEVESALVALDRVSDNAIVLIASAYFESTLAELQALLQVTDTALSTLHLSQMLQSLLARILEAVQADVGEVFLPDEHGAKSSIRFAIGLPDERGSVTGLPPGNLVGQVLATGRAMQIIDAQNDPFVVDTRLMRAGVGPAMCVPLRFGSKAIGTVQVGRLAARPFNRREEQLMELLADRAAAAIEHARLYEGTSRLLRQTAALQRVTSSMSVRMALPQVMDAVIEGVVEVFGANRVAIFLKDSSSGEASCPASRGLSAQLIEALKSQYKAVRARYGGETASQFAKALNFYVPDARLDPLLAPLQPFLDREGVRTMLVLPFGQPLEAAGALCLFHDEVRHYDDDERRLAQTFADQMGIAIAHATLYREIDERAAELDRANNELQALDRMKADFLAMVSHELRTPLTAILGYTDLLLRGARGELAERPSADLRTIRTNGQRLLGLINDLIDFSSIEAGRSPITLREQPLSLILPQVLGAFRPLAESRSITLRAELPPELPPLRADVAAVQKILNQLLSNALKFTPAGGTVVVRAAESRDAVPTRTGAKAVSRVSSRGQERLVSVDHWIVITVSDNGVGIPQEQLSRIWDHFYQVDSSSARRFGGTGLGLAIVRRLVELQGGNVWAESEGLSGHGSAFGFSLPVAC